MAYTAVGSVVEGTSTTTTTCTATFNPSAIGDVLVVYSSRNGAGAISGISHSGVTTWSKLINSASTEIWWGVVTATGSATLTVSYSGSHSNDIFVAQFHSSVAGTWTADTSTTTASSSTASGSLTGITPQAADTAPLYLCNAGYSSTASAFSMTGTGVVSTGSSTFLSACGYILSPGVGSTSSGWTDTSNTSSVNGAAGFLYVVSNSLASSYIVRQAVQRAATR